MTQEAKQLLLQDLCARLPYGVKIHTWYGEIVTSDLNTFSVGYDEIDIEQLDGMKPYLRPMSSITEEEKDYIKNVARFKQSDGIHYDDGVHYVPIYQETLDDQWKTDGKFPPILGDIYRFMLDYGYILLIDFFNSHHIDYRGLIPKGLAFEAPEGMYNTKIE